MSHVWNLMRGWWARALGWFSPKTRQYQLLRVNVALPAQLRDRVLYVIEEDGIDEQAALLCPCGCGAVLHLNLLSDERPRWLVAVDQSGRPSLQPSVWRKVGCRSHFWLRHGTIDWCRE